MPRKLSKKMQAEMEAEALKRRYTCQMCEIETGDGRKDVFIFRGKVTFYCPVHNSFQHYFQHGTGYWRRQGEQYQN